MTKPDRSEQVKAYQARRIAAYEAHKKTLLYKLFGRDSLFCKITAIDMICGCCMVSAFLFCKIATKVANRNVYMGYCILIALVVFKVLECVVIFEFSYESNLKSYIKRANYGSQTTGILNGNGENIIEKEKQAEAESQKENHDLPPEKEQSENI